MEVQFADESLAAIETARAAETKLPLSVVASARKKLAYIRAAPDERSLRNWRSLHYEKMAQRPGQRSIRLNDQWRMMLELDDSTSPPKIVVLSIEKHYEKG